MNIRTFLPVDWQLRRARTIKSIADKRAANAAIDYRDRISVITWLFVFALGISQLYSLPTTQITLRALGSPVTIALTKTLVAAIGLALYAAAGVESVIQVHPSFLNEARRKWAWPFWALPMAIAIIAVYVLPLLTIGVWRLVKHRSTPVEAL